MRVLVLSPYVPYAAIDHAGGAYLLQHVEALLAGGLEVTLVAPAQGNELATAPPAGLDVRLVQAAEATSRTHQRYRNLRNLLQGLTPGVQVLAAMRGSEVLARAVREADLVEIEWPYLLPLAPDVRRWSPGVPLTAVEHDLAGDVYVSTGESAARAAIRWKYRLSAGRVARQEVSLLNLCSKVLVFTDRDRDTLRSRGLTVPTRVLHPFVETDVELSTGSPEGARVLFTGALHRPANYEGLQWFLTRVWPLVRSSRPDAVFAVAGANPPAWLVSDPSTGVEVVGRVEDLATEYVRSDLFVAPLLVGAGIKVKVPQAMAHGLVVVGTTVAAQGLEDAPPEALAGRTEDPAGFAAAVTRMLNDPEARADGGRVAAAWVRQNFDTGTSLGEVVADYRALAGG